MDIYFYVCISMMGRSSDLIQPPHRVSRHCFRQSYVRRVCTAIDSIFGVYGLWRRYTYKRPDCEKKRECIHTLHLKYLSNELKKKGGRTGMFS